MLFNLAIFALFAAIAYFHYTEGLFSASLSAIIAIVATAVTMGYHDLITPYLMKMPEQADAVGIIGLFAATYGILRFLFDKVVPGNVQFPLMMDKVGAGAMGLIAGLLGSGVVAVAAQSLPFGPSIGGYSRQDLHDRPNITIPSSDSGARPVDTQVTDELIGDTLGDPNHLAHLWFHQDEFAMGVANAVSAAGSALTSGLPLDTAHPDFITEIYGDRLGMPTGTRHLAVGASTGANFSVKSAFRLAKPEKKMDDEIRSVRGDMAFPDIVGPLVVVRVGLTGNSTDIADADGIIRFSPASVRLKAGSHDYYPIGTLVGGTLLLRNRPDDPLMADAAKGEQTIDFVFSISDDDLKPAPPGDKQKTMHFKDDSFIEFKRFAVADLSGRELAADVPRSKVESASSFASNSILGGLLRKLTIGNTALEQLAQTPPPSAAPKSRSGNPSAGNQAPTNSPGGAINSAGNAVKNFLRGGAGTGTGN